MNYYNIRVTPVGYEQYTVMKGDTLYSIAKKFNTTIAEITDINSLTSNEIYPNQVLVVPSTKGNTDYTEYVTKNNDTINKISQKLNVSQSELGEYNNFANLELEKGQILKYPKSVVTYTIKDNDTIESILSKTNRNCNELLKLNANSWLKAGNVINV